MVTWTSSAKSTREPESERGSSSRRRPTCAITGSNLAPIIFALAHSLVLLRVLFARARRRTHTHTHRRGRRAAASSHAAPSCSTTCHTSRHFARREKRQMMRYRGVPKCVAARRWRTGLRTQLSPRARQRGWPPKSRATIGRRAAARTSPESTRASSGKTYPSSQSPVTPKWCPSIAPAGR